MVVREFSYQLLGIDVPKQDSPICPSARQEVTVGAEGHIDDHAIVSSRDLTDHLAGVYIQ